MRAARRRGMLGAMGNPYGITLDEASLRWAAAEGVPESVIAAICLLDEKSVDEIVAKLSPVELEQVIKIVGRSPRGYPPGAYDALKEHRRTPSPEHAANVSAVTNRAKVPLNASQRATANPYGITLDRVWTDWAAHMACPKRSRQLSALFPGTGGSERSWLSLRRARSSES